MWIFSGILLLTATIVPFAVTALAGWTGTDLEDKRARMRGMFFFGCFVYALLVGLTAWTTSHPQIMLASLILWALPLTSSGLAVALLWRKRPAVSPEQPDIGFSP